MSRLLLLKNYNQALKSAGLTGYGMQATERFPPNIPHVPFDNVTRKQLPIIDNSYVLLTLRGGWIESLAFVLLHLIGVCQFLLVGRLSGPLSRFGYHMAATILGHAFVVFTVYPDYDFMFIFLWTIGVSSAHLGVDSRCLSVSRLDDSG